MGLRLATGEVRMATNIESSRSPVNNYDQQEKSAFQFLTMCVVLAAMIFGLIHAVTYFTNSTGAGTAHTSATARTLVYP